MRNDGGANAQPGCRAIGDAGAEARSILKCLLARVNSCPDTKARRKLGGTEWVAGAPSRFCLKFDLPMVGCGWFMAAASHVDATGSHVRSDERSGARRGGPRNPAAGSSNLGDCPPQLVSLEFG